jgi:hypothetical protein
MSSEKTTIEKDYDLALQTVADQMERDGFEVLGGSNAPDDPYSLVLSRVGKLVAVKVTAMRAPSSPSYSPTQLEELKAFALQNGINRVAMAPVGLMPAGMSPEGEEGFYVKFDGLVLP